MNKKILFLALFIFTFSIGIISGLENTVCCEETTSGAVCQNVPESQCKTSASQESCEQTSFCQLGTCVSASTGECSANTPKKVCEEKNGQWYLEDVDSIEQCKRGCCSVGDQVAFVSNVECKRIATDYGVDIRFRSDISDEASCLLLSEPEETGACTFLSEGSRRCSMETKQICSDKGGDWFEGLLCTAGSFDGDTGNFSDCSPTENKICHEDDIYFLDSCGNLANVYDVRMFAKKGETWTQEMNEYWEKKMEPNCAIGSVGCGNCDYTQGSVCSQDKNEFSCKSLSCEDVNNDGSKTTDDNYKHGESWCAESEGVYPNILVNPFNMEYVNTGKDIVAELREGYEEYNLPGSRYYKLTCWEGEVITEPCADYRNEICKEGVIANEETDESFRLAQCRTNAWRTCFDIGDKETCEDPIIDCKWIYGYRLDGQVVPEESRDNEQGSCVPLYAPGFDFWNPGNSGEAICALGTVKETVLYETNWAQEGKREEIETSLGTSAERCFENCYAIPQYADKNTLSFMEALHKGDEKIKAAEIVSNRKGYYCENGTGWETGEVTCGFSVGSLTDKDFKPLPVFLRNEDWLSSITERAKSLGDCGYKENFVGESGQYSSEIITRIFQELKRDDSVEVNHTAIISYEGNDWTGKDARSPEPGASN